MSLEDFSIVDTIAEGAIGRILLARDRRIEREVAIKEIKEDRLISAKERVLARFVREAKITGQLEHPGIVPVYEISHKPDGTPFYVMKYIQGRTLHEEISACKAPVPSEAFALRLSLLDKFITVCEAVSYAHSKGVIHRDLKLGNIILGEFGEVAIIDWGLAKRYKTESDEQAPSLIPGAIKEEDTLKTIDGAILGTPSYMSPEQIDRKFGNVDPKSDIYSLGVILFTILTGQRPYKEKGEAVLRMITSGAPSPKAIDRCNFIPPPLSAICAKAMAKDKQDRFETAADLARELKRYRDGRLVNVYSYSRTELFRRFVERNKAAFVAACVVILAIIFGSAVSINFAVKAHRAKIAAENTLINVTLLAETAAHMAEDSVFKIEAYFKALPKKKRPEALANIAKILPDMIGHDPKQSMEQIWLMTTDGKILYDEDDSELGRNLFTDPLYQDFPELIDFGKEVVALSWGIGYYNYYGRNNVAVKKVAAWDTADLPDGDHIRLVAAYQYE